MRDNGQSFLVRLGLAFSLWLVGGMCYATPYGVANLGLGGTAVGTSQRTWDVGGGYTLTATAYSTPTNYVANGAVTANSLTSTGAQWADQQANPAGAGQTTSGYLTTEGSGFNGYYSCTGSACGAAGQWATARIFQYGTSGLGISNNIEGAVTSNDGSAPQHAMDNNGAIDVVVFSLLNSSGVAQVFDPTSFRLGYVNNDSDVQAWIGNSFNPTHVCFTNCANAADNIIGGATGFTEISAGIAPTVADPSGATSGANIPVNTDENFNTTQTGRYLVMAGNLGLTAGLSGGNDFFKLSALTVNRVPVPATVPLLVLGLMALGFTRRRALLASSAR